MLRLLQFQLLLTPFSQKLRTEAGVQAGFKQVVLLQEPIAASLAYANMKKEREMLDGQWLVYDLGGGTFDVALN
jgi:molecular chaperone DnaK